MELLLQRQRLSASTGPWRSRQPALFWSMTVTSPMTRSDSVATLEEAKAQFEELGRVEGRGRSGKRSNLA
jgi:hypothetical protein